MERGIYRGPTEDSFVSSREIKRKLAIEGNLPRMEHLTPIKLPLTADNYLEKASKRATQMKEMAPQADNFVEVFLANTTILNFWGDLHNFHYETDHERIRRELEVMKNTEDSAVVFGGDIFDGIFWGGESGGEQVESTTHQTMAMKALWDELKGRVIVGLSGEHDSKWAAKTGGDPYSEFSERTGAPYVRGVAEVLIHVGEQEYKLVIQHTPRGSSIYNKNHPTMRQARFDLQGADIYANFHTHRKQISQEAIRSFGRSRIVTHFSGGAYKRKDGYGDRIGYVSMNPEEMYGGSIRLHADRHKVDTEYDILEAHRRWGGNEGKKLA